MLALGVDALNLVADRRGMGRFARTVLCGLRDVPEVRACLIVRDPAHAEMLRDEMGMNAVLLPDVARARLDAVWYPWNGVRFVPHSPHFVTIHDTFAFTRPHGNLIARWREQAPIRRGIRSADAFSTVSRWSAGEIQRIFHIDRSRVEVINPIPDAFWKPIAVPRPRSPYMLFVAGPDERKNAGLLFAAFERAFPYRDVMLIVAGKLRDGDEDALGSARIAQQRVRPDDETLRELYSGALAVVIPSLAEGYGVMAVEAMACGAPVIAADAAALPEACDGAAVLAPPTGLDAWSDALARVAGDSTLRAQMQRRSLDRAAKIDRTHPARAIAALARRVAAAGR
ncbi:MAG: glycosyltransferase family 4 protein [Candidatus Eremiobacteraeota bacterium]|nr:glycosyltransferase family 4 protein [Candidatus Eremiobacteraeota bacterium]